MAEPGQPWRLLRAGDPALAPSEHPARSMARLRSARLGTAADDDVRRIAALLDEHGAALADRGCAPAHLTGSALVLEPSTGRVAVLLHAKLRRWLQPGGHADGDHELAGVALREATEETGIEGLAVLVPAVDVDIHPVDHGDALGEHLHLDLRFLVVAPPGAQLHANRESLDLRFVDLEELASLADEPGLLRLARAGMAAARDAGVIS